MNLKDLIGGAFNRLRGTQMTSPVSANFDGGQIQSGAPIGYEDYNNAAIKAGRSPLPTPQPSPQPTQPRNPLWQRWQQAQPKRFEELLSGAQIAASKYGVPFELLMDISGLETSGGQFMEQIGGGPGRGYFQFEEDTLNGLGSKIDPNSATESADLTASLIAKKQLSRWGTPAGGWGTLNNQKNTNGKLTDWYSNEELNPYLADQYQLR